MQTSDEIRWGILGCGDVCEVKSGPAFNKVPHSRLVAVMRRDGAKARDFARRHGVPKSYDDADRLINDPEVNAIYIATPPAFHEGYAISAMEAGKPVYIEKPVTLDTASCRRLMEKSRSTGVKASVAHYRRGLPVFRRIRSLIAEGAIGVPRFIDVKTLQAPSEKMQSSGYWRTNTSISGGGVFFDLAPHQLDIFYWIFGEPKMVRGYSLNQSRAYDAPDLTHLEAVFGGDVYLHGIWAFNVSTASEEEICEINGDEGKIVFSFFRKSDIDVVTPAGRETITLDYPENIQQPMIADVTDYFRNKGQNPCSLDEALVTISMMEKTRG